MRQKDKERKTKGVRVQGKENMKRNNNNSEGNVHACRQWLVIGLYGQKAETDDVIGERKEMFDANGQMDRDIKKRYQKSQIRALEGSSRGESNAIEPKITREKKFSSDDDDHEKEGDERT